MLNKDVSKICCNQVHNKHIHNEKITVKGTNEALVEHHFIDEQISARK